MFSESCDEHQASTAAQGAVMCGYKCCTPFLYVATHMQVHSLQNIMGGTGELQMHIKMGHSSPRVGLDGAGLMMYLSK